MSVAWFAPGVPTQAFEQAVRRAARRAAAAFGTDIKRLRQDAGIPRAVLARAAGLDQSYLRRIEEGEAEPSIDAGTRLTAALGADLSLRAYPNTGSPIRDRHQAPIEEALLRIVHPRWRPFAEIAVRRPARGWIDLGLHDPSERVFVATEIESGLRRLEQLLRWHGEKAASLSSWDGFSSVATDTTISKLLVVMDTRTNREVAVESRRLLAAAYPADPRDALAALTGGVGWPGSAVLWAARNRSTGPRFRIIARP